MQSLIDVLIYMVLVGGALAAVSGLLYGIHNLIVRIRYVNARLIWQIVARHRHA